MNNTAATPASSASRATPILLVLVVIGLLAYYFWPRSNAPAPPAQATVEPVISETPSTGASSAGLPSGAREVGGILVDAQGNRILNEAGLPISKEPLPQAKAIPIKAAPGEVIGYTKDAQGNSQPIRAGDLKAVPNSPGTFAVVDMWAEGGPTVVAPTKGQPISQADLAKMRAEEDRRDRSGGASPP